MSKWAVVCPTIRPQEYERFMKAWDQLFFDHDVTVYPVRDEPASWKDWPDWVPRQSDQCRSWGFYQAWLGGHDFILSLDDDVRPFREASHSMHVGVDGIHDRDRGEPVDIFAEYEAAFARDWPCVPYLSVGALVDASPFAPMEMRGFPYENREARCMVQYGGWHGVPDLDGRTQLGIDEHVATLYGSFAQAVIPVPRGCATTCCAMNMAWLREFTPCMWQLPVLGDRFKRWGDIWSGLIQKRVLDARGEVMLVNGRASVLHERASDPVKNAELEAPGMQWNEGVWECSGWNNDGSFEGVTDMLVAGFPTDYQAHYFRCRDEWLALFTHDRAAA